MHPDEAVAQLITGAAQIISETELREKLALARPLRVKLGADPTSPDLHLGHTIALRKLRQFQELGHEAVLIIGDYTAMVGDPSGRSVTRPQLSREEVLAHAETYRAQAFKVLDPAHTQVVYNGEWFAKMGFEDIMRLNSRVTLQQMLQREDFRERVEQQQPIHAHEIQYPIMQGWDSVMVQADVELGGTDQLFNILVGRDFQKQEGLAPQVAMMLPILEGLDGVKKMSKSLGNYIGVDESAPEMFGKIMSIS
ncbi:MAG: tyrosine--tRNA ligase, partial [Verrucomicrobiota bacterium]|nr:tyrosine--tRNA ligase [Verrucomicrobiota bacterium]